MVVAELTKFLKIIAPGRRPSVRAIFTSSNIARRSHLRKEAREMREEIELGVHALEVALAIDDPA